MKKIISIIFMISAIFLITGCEIDFGSSSSFSDDKGFTTTEEVPIITRPTTTTYKTTKATQKIQCNQSQGTKGASISGIINIKYDDDTKIVKAIDEERHFQSDSKKEIDEMNRLLLNTSSIYNKIPGITMSVLDKTYEITARISVVYTTLNIQKAKEVIDQYNEYNPEDRINYAEEYLILNNPLNLTQVVNFLKTRGYSCNV